MGSGRPGYPIVLLAVLALVGSTGVDDFSPRAVTYNQHAEDIKENLLMFNVMRAAYREPLQFTDFTQVTGQTSLSGTAAFSLPFDPAPATYGHSNVASPSAIISGTQAFSVANLDTQEFYQGILSPIPITSIDYYLEQGFPPALLLSLVVSRVNIEAGKSSRLSFDNDAGPGDFVRFKALLSAFLDLGLSSGEGKTLTNVGPPITASDMASLRALAPLAEGAALKHFTSNTDPDLTPTERADLTRRGVTEYFRLQQSTQRSRFCIDPNHQNLTAASDALANLGVLSGGDLIVGSPTAPADTALDAAAERCGGITLGAHESS